MNVLHQILAADWITQLGWVLLHSLWEIALLTAVLALPLSLLRRGSANLRYLVACGGLVIMAIAPIVTYGLLPAGRAPDGAASAIVEETTAQPIANIAVNEIATVEGGTERTGFPVSVHVGEGTAAASSPPIVVASPSPEPTAESQEPALRRIAAAMSPWMPWCVVVWFVGVFSVSVWNLGGWTVAQRFRRLGTNPIGEEISHRLSTLAERSGINRSVAIMKSLMVEVPVVVGWLRPMILLPARVLTGLTPAELDAILAHELAHIRRHDYLVNLVQTVIETLFFYHPGVWWLSRQIRSERELCCDDIAVAVCGNKIDYASALAAVEAGRGAPKMVMGACKADSSTLGRVRRVLGLAGGTSCRWGRSLAGGLITATMIVALVTCLAVTDDRTTGSADWSAAAAKVFPDWKVAESGRYEKADIGAAKASRLLLSQKRRQYIGQPMQQELAMATDEGPDDPNYRNVFSRIDIYTFDEKADLPKDAIKKLSWTEWEDTDGYFVKTVDLGAGLGRRWFVRTRLAWQDQLRRKLKLVGGDDPIRLLAEGLLFKGKNTMSAKRLEHHLAFYGDKAVAYLKRQINKTNSPEDLARLVRPLAYIQTKAADNLLNVLYADPKAEAAAGNAVARGKPRKGAKAIYLDLLKKRRSIHYVGVACVAFNWQEAAPILRDIHATPKNRGQWEFSFTALRNLEGRPIPRQLHDARYSIMRADDPEKDVIAEKAQNVILNSPDTEAAAFIATYLANCPGFKTSGGKIQAIKRIGKELVAKLANQAGDLAARRNRLLAHADAAIRAGLVKLAQKYPYLKKAKAWRTVSVKSKPGRIDVFIVHTKHQGSKAAQPTGDPEGEEVTILVYLEEPRSKENQLAGPIYPNLGLVGQISTRADNANLDAELKQLVADALKPLARLNSIAKASPANEWGKAVEGVQVRLRMDKRVWKVGETPTFSVEARNGAKSTLFDTDGRLDIFNMEFDGHWYTNLIKVRKIRRLQVLPGQQNKKLNALRLSPENWWGTTPPRTLGLTPGKHTVRVAFAGTLGGGSVADGGKPIRVVSKPVVIEVISDKQIAARAEGLKSRKNSFELSLQYHGPKDNPSQSGVKNPIQSLIIHTTMTFYDLPSTWRSVRISEQQAAKIIDHLKAEGFLVNARSLTDDGPPKVVGPTYSLTVKGPDKLVLHEVLGWDLKMLARLDALRKVLDPKAPKYDELLARLKPQRKQWKAASEWGPAIKGVQVRLGVEKRVWKVGETPTLKVDVRNGAKSTLFDTDGRPDIYNLEFDGHWYVNGSRVRKRRRLQVLTGRQAEDLGVLPLSPKYWRKISPAAELTPGKHTVRVAFAGTLGARLKADGGKPVRVVSNPVEIEILPAKGVASGVLAVRGQPPLPKMISVSDDAVGITFDRPADWLVDPTVYPNGTNVGFRQQRSVVDSVWASIRVSMEDNSAPTRINTVSPPNPKAIASRILRIDGLPARLTALLILGSGTKATPTEQLVVMTARGTRSYRLTMIYPSNRHDEYLRLALAICRSMRFHRNVAWGKTVNGLQAGLATIRDHTRPYQLGQNVPLRFLLRNTTNKPITLTHARVPVFIHWDNYRRPPGPQLFDPDGKQVFPARGVGGRGLPGAVARTIAPGQMIAMTDVRLPLRAGNWKGTTVNLLTYLVKPGKHRVSLSYGFTDNGGGHWGGTVTTGMLDLHVNANDKPPSVPDNAWGKENNGVRCRLSVDRARLRSGQPPILLVDLHNRHTQRTIKQLWYGLEFKLEVDGKWTGKISPTQSSGPVAYLTPDQEWINVPLVLQDSQYYMSSANGRTSVPAPFAKLLGPGRHTIRVNIDGVISNPVKIEISPPKPKPKTPDITADDENTVKALRKLGELGARLTLNKQGQVTKIDLSPAWATATELALLKTLPKLEYLIIGRLAIANQPEKIKMTEADLIHLKGLTSLKQLWISGVPVSDASMTHIKGLTRLEVLRLMGAKITGAGLKHLGGLTNLKELYIGFSTIKDAGLVQLKPLTKIEMLDVSHTQITDAGLAHLKTCTKLRWLDLSVTKVTDAGLAHLASLGNLRALHLSSAVTDAGLTHLKGLTKLETIDLRGTQVTKEAVKQLLQAIPRLKTIR
jgi:beta-lactamase regulating signal transducer with metallopeptidase domain